MEWRAYECIGRIKVSQLAFYIWRVALLRHVYWEESLCSYYVQL